MERFWTTYQQAPLRRLYTPFRPLIWRIIKMNGNNYIIDGKNFYAFNSLGEERGCIYRPALDTLKWMTYSQRHKYLHDLWVPRSIQKTINSYLDAH